VIGADDDISEAIAIEVAGRRDALAGVIVRRSAAELEPVGSVQCVCPGDLES
jgi:hypothetical protein